MRQTALAAILFLAGTSVVPSVTDGVRLAADTLVERAQDAPPKEPGPFRDPDLVELRTLDPTIKLDIRYATPNNVAGRAVYSQARAFLQRPAATALVLAHRALAADGYGLLIFDGYRAWRVTKLFWDTTPPEKREFVADPSKGSKHNRGCAVDLSMYDLATGRSRNRFRRSRFGRTCQRVPRSCARLARF